MDKIFWKNKKILITGHSGFKGSWLALILSQYGAEVYGLSDNSNTSRLYDLHNRDYLEKEYILDVSNKSFDIENIFIENNFDVVFHLAAQALISKAKSEPRLTLETNILGTFNILEMVDRYANEAALIVSTTDKVYGNPELRNTENDALRGTEFYSMSKVAAENVIDSYLYSINNRLKVTVIRSGNVLGPGDNADDRLITDLIKSIKNQRDIILRNPGSIRPWQYVLDSLSGYILAAEKSIGNSVHGKFNLNSDLNSDYKVIDIAEKMKTIWDTKVNIRIEKNTHLKETPVLRINSDKAKNILGWDSETEMDEILLKIYEWENNLEEIELISKKQIQKFFE